MAKETLQDVLVRGDGIRLAPEEVEVAGSIESRRIVGCHTIEVFQPEQGQAGDDGGGLPPRVVWNVPLSDRRGRPQALDCRESLFRALNFPDDRLPLHTATARHTGWLETYPPIDVLRYLADRIRNEHPIPRGQVFLEKQGLTLGSNLTGAIPGYLALLHGEALPIGLGSERLATLEQPDMGQLRERIEPQQVDLTATSSRG
ncbi:MAG: hypothetical protein HY319_31935 [Armatimonadetes bacterium]|nr:hypothetical protein [Armatimonadota bacterium]